MKNVKWYMVNDFRLAEAFILPPSSLKVGSPPALSPSPAGSLGIGQPRGWPILFPQTLQSVRGNRPVVCDLKYLANIRFGQRQPLIQDAPNLSACLHLNSVPFRKQRPRHSESCSHAGANSCTLAATGDRSD